MLEQIRNPSPCFKDVINTHFWLKRNEICQQIESWITELSRPQVSERSGRAISFNSMVLRRQYRQLREELAKLPCPEGLENFDNVFSVNPPPSVGNSGINMASSSASTSSMSAAISKSPEGYEEGKEKTLLELINSNDDDKNEMEIILSAAGQENSNESVIDEFLNYSDTSLELLDKATKTMKDIEKMLTDDME
jgi:hypothetical protein